MKKYFLAGILLLITVTGIYFVKSQILPQEYFMQPSMRVEEPIVNDDTLNTKKPAYSVEPGIRDGWNRYSNNNQSFSIEYPGEYFTNVMDEEEISGPLPEGVSLLVHITPPGQGQLGNLFTIVVQKTSFEEFESKHKDWDTTFVNGVHGYKRIADESRGGSDPLHTHRADFLLNNKEYSFLISSPNEEYIQKNAEVFGEMIGTFSYWGSEKSL